MIRKTLADVASGDCCVVVEIASEPVELKSRLYALGVLPGSTLQVLRLAPMGDPMQVKVGGSSLSIRRSEAEIIAVDVQPSTSE